MSDVDDASGDMCGVLYGVLASSMDRFAAVRGGEGLDDNGVFIGEADLSGVSTDGIGLRNRSWGVGNGGLLLYSWRCVNGHRGRGGLLFLLLRSLNSLGERGKDVAFCCAGVIGAVQAEGGDDGILIEVLLASEGVEVFHPVFDLALVAEVLTSEFEYEFSQSCCCVGLLVDMVCWLYKVFYWWCDLFLLNRCTI